MAGALLLAGCTERLTSPGNCPALCPGGSLDVRDTILDAVVGGDSSFTGYRSVTDPLSLLVSDGGTLGETRSVIRFIGRGDSVLVADTLRPFTTDSVVISIFLQARDTTVSPLFLDLYRLPAAFDTAATFAELDAAMTPDKLLRTVEIVDSARSGRYPIVFKDAELDKFTFAPEDSTRLVVGLRLRSATPAGAYFGASLSGDGTPLYITYTAVDVPDTALQHAPLQRSVADNWNVSSGAAPPDPDRLRIGGFPAARSLLRFALPEYLRDSATIVRATLELVPVAPRTGIPGDSARIDAFGLLADIGAKSPINSARSASTWIHPGSDTIRVDMANLVELWQGSAPLPSAIRVQLGQEGASFLAPLLGSSRSATSRPRLRISYRTPYALEGF